MGRILPEPFAEPRIVARGGAGEDGAEHQSEAHIKVR
jgi:hypothetical protein